MISTAEKKTVDVDRAIYVIKDSIDCMDMDALVGLIEYLMPCKNVTYNVDNDTLEYEIHDDFKEFENLDPFR
jgi:hypothetical protein